MDREQATDMGDSLALRALPTERPSDRKVVGASSVLLKPEHRVIVRHCAGFDCRNPITTHRVQQNIHGIREYCGLVCYSRWSPGMRSVTARFLDYDQSPIGLEALILDLKKEQGVGGAARALGVSRSTVSYWLRKLEFYRQFAGQSPEAILAILADIADDRGINEASKLIAVDPKTLQRAIAKIPKNAA